MYEFLLGSAFRGYYCYMSLKLKTYPEDYEE